MTPSLVRRPSFPGCRLPSLEQSVTSRHVCTVTACFLQSSEDSSLQPQFSLTILLCLRSDTGHYGHFNLCSYLLTYLQCAWSTIEREAYAIIWALNKFRDIVYGSKITVGCDHNPLQYIRDCTPKSAKLLRWSLALQEFDLKIKYKRGSDDVVADYLSRSV